MERLPTERVELASWPTPLEPAPRLASAIGLQAGDLWIKRDDLAGLAAGGNKIRKLEWTVAAALSERERKRLGALLADIRAEHDLKADFFCFWLSATGHVGPEIAAETLGRIAALNAKIGIDFYGPVDESD
jgi:hypothetical protein